jgi:hypothetical protein
MRIATRSLTALATLTLVASLSACSSDATDDGDGADGDCGPGETYNSISGECEPRQRSTGEDAGDDETVDSRSFTDTDDPADPNDREDAGDDPVRTDTSSDDDPDAGTCDIDGDGFRAEACGGEDCNDDNRAINPDAPEICDQVDNDCDGEVDEGVDCSFYAHSQSQLYNIDPFTGTLTERSASNAPFQNFLDMDTHPDGDLWAVTSSALYRLPGGGDAWQREATLLTTPVNFNGMAIGRRGTAYLTGGNSLYKLDLSDTGGELSPTKVGDMGGNYQSSGDCVVDRKGSLMMTSTDPSGSGNDVLVELNTRTAEPTEIGQTDHAKIWGLTAGWSKLYGTTSDGELIEIDSDDGSSTTVETFSSASIYGAASTPASRRE